MKKLSIAVMLVLGVLAFHEFNFSLDENGYIARQVTPYFRTRIQPVLAESVNPWLRRFGLQTLDEDAGGASGPGPDQPRGESAALRRVIDGDTIDVRLNGETERVRYIGINTPERDEPCYREATEANRALLAARELTLVPDTTDRDDYGRLLRYVYADSSLVERELVRQGYAEAIVIGPDDRHFSELRRLEEAAALLDLGCHGTGIFDDGNARG